MTDTKELVEHLRDVLGGYGWEIRDPALAALSELEAQLEAVGDESLAAHQRAEAAERERDAGQAAVRLEHQSRIEHQARVAELEEALREIAHPTRVKKGSVQRDQEIARAALDRAKEESPFPKPKMVEIGEERASGKAKP